MTAQPRHSPKQCRPSGCSSSGRLRQFAIYILLLAISALALQAPAHASPAGHPVYLEQTAATAGHCAPHHQHGTEPSSGCLSHAGGPSLADCCQTCLTAPIFVAPPSFRAAVNGDVFRAMRPDLPERSPCRILRPPRLVAV